MSEADQVHSLARQKPQFNLTCTIRSAFRTGEDLHRVLWLKSRNSEVWLDRRTTYTRSTAVLSVVGYLLGLGDRHPSNLMLDRCEANIIASIGLQATRSMQVTWPCHALLVMSLYTVQPDFQRHASASTVAQS